MRAMEMVSGGDVGGEAAMVKALMAESETTLLPMKWHPGINVSSREGTLYLELCMRYSPSQPVAGAMFNASRAWQAALLWEDVVMVANALGGIYPGLVAAAGMVSIGGLPATLIDGLAQLYVPGCGLGMEVRVLEAIQQPGTGPMAARMFTDRRNVGAMPAFNGAQLCTDAANRAAGSLTVHIWPDASRVVRPSRSLR